MGRGNLPEEPHNRKDDVKPYVPYEEEETPPPSAEEEG